MAETLTSTPHSSPEASPAPLSERLGDDEEKFRQITAELHEVRARVAGLIDDAPEATHSRPDDETAVLDTPETTDPPVDSAEPATDTPERAERKDPRSRLRKIGDFALAKMENGSNTAPVKMLEAWGIIPLRGTWHKHRGFNTSAWVARRYMKAQERRKERIAGFLSEEANAQLSGETSPAAIDPSEKAPRVVEEARDEAHARAETASEDKAERKEEHPDHEHEAELRQRLHQLRSELGARALAAAAY